MTTMPSPARQILRNPIHLLAFGFGAGLSPKMPGTIGTLAAVPFYLLMMNLSWPLYLGVLVVTSVVGIYLCHKTALDLGVHDHPGIVWDEFVGYWITLFLAPKGLVWIVIGFILFRFFDIFKPWPIRWFDRHVHGGIGIMLDDVIAGMCAWACLQCIAWYWLG